MSYKEKMIKAHEQNVSTLRMPGLRDSGIFKWNDYSNTNSRQSHKKESSSSSRVTGKLTEVHPGKLNNVWAQEGP